MSLKERIKRLEYAAATTKIDWDQLGIDCATIFISLDNGEPWEAVSSKLSVHTIDVLELSAGYWQRVLDDLKAGYEKTFGVGSYEMNQKGGDQ